MCGIVGYVGKRSAQDVLLDGLEKLEYRGYDSAGVALALDGGIRVVKSKGRLTALREKLAAQQLAQSFCGIGHTRWATHGEPSDVNSPFLDWNFGWMMEKIVIPVVSCIGKLFPNLTVQGYGDASYAHSLLKQFKGEWVYNTDWKMINGHPKKAGWINAIQEAQKTVQKGIGLDCPVLVMSSNKSFPETKEWNNEYLSSDIVLDIHDIQKYGQKLGNYVTRDTIQNGIHDLILSEKDSRDHVYRTVFDWLPGK